MNTHYIMMPTDYIQELHAKKQRKKASAFLEYFYDMHHKEVNAVRFYANSWDVKKSTAHNWIKDFVGEIEKFFNAWRIKNNQHYTSVQKQNGQEVDKVPLSNIDNIEVLKETPGHEVDKDYNIYSSSRGEEFLREFQELVFLVGRYIGNKEESYKAYIELDTNINIKVLSKAYKEYIKSIKEKSNILGLKKFIKQGLYLHYLPKRVKIKGIVGFIDIKQEIFVANNQTYKLTASTYLNKLKNQEVEFVS